VGIVDDDETDGADLTASQTGVHLRDVPWAVSAEAAAPHALRHLLSLGIARALRTSGREALEAVAVTEVTELPWSKAAEEAVLGGLLMDSVAWYNVSDVVQTEDFYRPDHRIIFDAIRALATNQKPTDAVTVAEHLERHGLAAGVGGLAYLGTLARDTPTAANVRAYAEIVHERAIKRQLIEAGRDITSAAFGDNGHTARELTLQAVARIEAVRSVLQPDASWPAPVNLFAEMAAPPFVAGDLPAPLSAYAIAFASRSGIDQTITLTAAAAVAAMAIDDTFVLEADGSTKWQQPARLWVLNIGHPGSGKTPAQRAMSAPLWEINGNVRKQWEADCAATSKDEPEPVLQRVVIGDTTIEGLSVALENNPRGVGIIADEFESWLGSIDTYRRTGAASRDRGAWLQAFDGGPHSIERVQRGSIFVPNWGVGILTATTPAAMAKLAKSLPEDGLLQRFIPAIARRQSLDPTPIEGIDSARETYASTIKRLFAASPRNNRRVVSLSYEAAAAFQVWRRENQLLGEAMGSLQPALESHMAKHPAMLLRVALTFHCAQVVSFGDAAARDPAAWPVTLDTMKTAIAFMTRTAKHAMALFLNLTGAGRAFELARDIARAVLVATDSVIARRDLQAKVRAFRAAAAHEQDAALSLLIDTSWLRAADSGYTKAHATRFDINPKIKAQFAQLAERERERRALLREAIADTVSAAKRCD
jgi:hypothetical protein